MTTIVFIRHGPTVWNLEKRYIGQTDLPLTEEGRLLLRQRATDSGYPAVDRLYISPLRRCRETAEVIYPDLRPRILSELTELNFGDFEGKTYRDLQDCPAYRDWIDSAGGSAPPNGEGRMAQYRRLCSALKIITDESIDTVAVVTHGGCIMSLLSGGNSDRFYDFQVSPGGGFLTEYDAASGQFLSIQPLSI